MLKLLSQLIRRMPVCICVAVSVISLSARGNGQSTAQPPAHTAPALAKEKTLAPNVAATWVQAVNRHKTADGSTVAQVLAFAQAKRPAKFKYQALKGGDDILYNGSSGPSRVGITYWVGSKRGEGENYVDIGYAMTPQGQVITPSTKDLPATLALEGGKQSFLKWLDQTYEEDCRDLQTNKLTC